MDITVQKLTSYLVALRAEAAHYEMHSHHDRLRAVREEIDRVEGALGIKQPPPAPAAGKRRVEKPAAVEDAASG